MGNEISFPRQHARTQRFTLGAPRTFTVAPDGSRVFFLRIASPTGKANGLWELDTKTGAERLLADPAVLLTTAQEDLPPEERARRERSRESAAGIVGYVTDKEATRASFTLSGRLFVTDLRTGESRELPTEGGVIDPRVDPTGARVAYVTGGALHVADLESGADTVVAAPDGDDVTWGVAEFIAAEEMSRYRGYWWSPDGTRLLAARVDNSPVRRWYIADPANPATPAAEIAYPAAGTPNAEVSLSVLGLDGSAVPVEASFDYLNSVHWSSGGSPLITVQTRDQRTVRVLELEPDSGSVSLLVEETDPVWLEVASPAWTPDGRLVRIVMVDDEYRLSVGDDVVSPAGIQVRSVLDVEDDSVLITGSEDDPTVIHVYSVGATTTRLSEEDGVSSAVRGGDTVLLATSTLDRFGARVTVAGHVVASHAETPVITPSVRMLTLGERGLRGALMLPTGHVTGTKVPVLLDPYGGPHAQRALSARNAHLTSQWLADQGFAVLVVDGRGTPGRGPAWEREIAFDFAGATLEDQVDALHAASAVEPDLDLSRVAIRGWSYGGYLAALAVLRRPDVFHAGIAGAPVTDWRLYDTHYTERYLGHPDERPEVYDTNSLIDDAAKLARPLMIIHGLADDNVVAAHGLRLSSALLAAGRPHTFLPLAGVTHMTPQEQVAENLLLLQVDFLKRSLA